MNEIQLAALARHFDLKSLTPAISAENIPICHADVNRPALQLAGYYEYFDEERVQLIGRVEYSFLCSHTREERLEIFSRLFATRIPCLIICHGIELPEQEDICRMATEAGIPLFSTTLSTAKLIAEMTRFLADSFAPSVSMHGVLIDCFGEGVLLLGDSGIGKSETALELVARGHRLVADDIVEITRASEKELVGHAPALLENLIELRGIGILNVRDMFGVQAIKNVKVIDMAIQLELWDKDKEYKRIASNEKMNILGNEIDMYSIPIRPGRNLAIIIESAAINHKQKRVGMDAAEELRQRLQNK